MKDKRKFALLLLFFPVLLLLIPPHLFDDPYSTVVFDRNRVLLGAHLADDGQWRFPNEQTLPVKYVVSLLCFEDANFFYHPGINPYSIGRAAYQNIKAKKIISGGSTLTMQLARLSGKNSRRTLWNKFTEILLALRIEACYSKAEILKMYASHTPFGGNVVGLSAASWRYFGKEVKEISWAEAALLAVLPNSPALRHPGRNRDLLLNKRNELLKKLNKKGIIDTETLLLSIAEPLPLKPVPLPQLSPHLVDRAWKEYKGKKIISSIDKDLQQKVNQVLLNHHTYLKSNQIWNAAVLVLDVESGKALAYAGNIPGLSGTDKGGAVDLILAARSTGSILKPILFAAMLDDGMMLPSSLLPDIPMQIGGFSPKNFSNTFDGAVPAKRALERSLNIPAVKMLQLYHYDRFYFLLKKMGMTTLDKAADHYGLSLILGGAEGTLWDIAGIYASMARMLNHYKSLESAYCTKDIRPPEYIYGKDLKIEKDQEKAVIGAGPIWLTEEALVEVNRPDEESAWKSYSGSGKIAWKTGTSFGFRDAWAIGVTSKYVVAVWAGNASGEGRPGLTGITAAAPILFDVFNLLPNSPWFNTPWDDLVKMPVCRLSGYKSSPLCDVVDTVFVQTKGQNSLPCPYHRQIILDQTKQYRVNAECESLDKLVYSSWFVLPPAQEWYYKTKNPFYKALPPWRKGCNDRAGGQAMELIIPRDFDKVYVPYELDGSPGKLVLEAAHRDPSATIYWHFDADYLGSTQGLHQFSINPVAGPHKLTLVDEDGNTLVKKFTVVKKQ